MKKPHEEEWATGEGALSGALYSGDTWIGSFTDPKRARLAVQAPALVQALLPLGGYAWVGANREWHLLTCWRTLHAPGHDCLDECRNVQRALNAAGVLE